MYGRILIRMRELVRQRWYVMTAHADEEADEDGLTILDVENVILAGSILERQRDRETREWKLPYSASGFLTGCANLQALGVRPTGHAGAERAKGV